MQVSGTILLASNKHAPLLSGSYTHPYIYTHIHTHTHIYILDKNTKQ